MAENERVLVTVSGNVPDDLDERVAGGLRPRADYRMIAECLEADIVDAGIALERTGRIGRAIRRLGVGPLLAWYAFRRRGDYDAVLTDGEQVGIPLAMLNRVFGTGGCSHVMIVHVLSVPKKMRLIRAARLAKTIDRYIVYCTRQAEVVIDELDVPAERVVLTSFMVDTEFFLPVVRPDRARPLICSAGLERRDYPTMMSAVDGLDVDVVIAAASPWSKQSDSTEGRAVPDNVSIRRLDLAELRQLYGESSIVVMPLVDVDFQAGITTILEAMSMGLPVICTRTPGQTDTIVDGSTGRYVAPGDAAALRGTIEELLARPDRADALGRRARTWAVETADVERYAERVAAVVSTALARSSGGSSAS